MSLPVAGTAFYAMAAGGPIELLRQDMAQVGIHLSATTARELLTELEPMSTDGILQFMASAHYTDILDLFSAHHDLLDKWVRLRRTLFSRMRSGCH